MCVLTIELQGEREREFCSPALVIEVMRFRVRLRISGIRLKSSLVASEFHTGNGNFGGTSGERYRFFAVVEDRKSNDSCNYADKRC